MSGPDRMVVVIDSCLVGDIGSRVARADHENAALLKLRKVAIVVRMQLPDLRVEPWREARHDRLLHHAGRHDGVVRLEGLGPRCDDVTVTLLP